MERKAQESRKGLTRREVPPALWSWRQEHVVDSWQSAVCGAFAGGFAAAVTTPLDVAKTRIMLAKAGSSTASGNVLSALHGVWRSQGLAGLFAGIFPRMASISLGGFIFLGAYDHARALLSESLPSNIGPELGAPEGPSTAALTERTFIGWVEKLGREKPQIGTSASAVRV
ncbi:S-adenosylmethionine mitochondrial carrier protein [Sciurus carolinensis]|uniref:Mitochondrial S-adenosylmethionine carrier protein n=1 Tax=Sciurus carolinensis TaxID=30640 RepID=A0AA41T897_SCICA|nr:S-adenosylmethionine mitochondrial carrier protein [Sciurus carolinensis]